MVVTRAVETRARRGADVEVLRETAMALRAQGRIEAWLEAAAAGGRSARGCAPLLPPGLCGQAARPGRAGAGGAQPCRRAGAGFASAGWSWACCCRRPATPRPRPSSSPPSPGSSRATPRPGSTRGRPCARPAATRGRGGLRGGTRSRPRSFRAAPEPRQPADRPGAPGGGLLHLRRAIELRPSYAEAHLRQGAALQKLSADGPKPTPATAIC